MRRANGLAGLFVLLLLAAGLTSCRFGPNDPKGAIDHLDIRESYHPINGYGAAVWIRGWAYDPDRAEVGLPVDIVIDGVKVATVDALQRRTEVVDQHPRAASSGFSAQIPLTTKATIQVCAVARNAGKGTDSLLGCKTLSGGPSGGGPDRSPYGSFPAIQFRSDPGYQWDPTTGLLTMIGYADDPDGAPVSVRIEVNGVPVQQVAASRPSPFFPGVNNIFDVSISGPARPALVCAHAVNIGPGSDKVLGCLGFPA